MSGLVELAGVWLATFAAPWAGAVSPLSLPLPASVNYAHVITNSVGGSPFSTDVRAPRVAANHNEQSGGDQLIEAAFNSCGFSRQEVIGAVGSPPTCTEAGQAKLEVFMTANKECTIQGDVITYRIFVRNVGDATATDVTWHFEAPEGTFIVDGASDGTLPNMPPGSNQEFYVTVSIFADIQTAIATVSLGYLDCETRKANYACQVETWCSCMSGPCPADGPEALACALNKPSFCAAAARRGCNNSKSAGTTHIINGDCSPPPEFPSRQQDGEPAIICDPAETNCAGSLPELGPRFPQAQGPVICAQDDPRGCTEFRPVLGARFAEAIDDLQPGECSVINDNVVITPAFHDAFLRFGAPSAPFMRPLYENDQDFVRLVHSLELTGIRHVNGVRSTLREVQDTYWPQIIQLIDAAAKKPPQTNQQLLQQYDAIVNQWLEALAEAQPDLTQRYQDMQNQRKEQFYSVMCEQTKESFDPSTCTAVEKARQAITAVCGLPGDGGLAGALPGVAATWEQQLDVRTGAYPGMQLTARNQLARRLQVELRGEIAAAGVEQAALERLLAFLHQQELLTFDSVATLYRTHIDGDRQAGTQVRINSWGPAADQPKTQATQCMYQQVQPPPVELTWCESGNYPQFIIREAPEPVKAARPGILPPQLIPGGQNAQIDPTQVQGTVCGGAPGDPFWASDCSCHCGELIRVGGVLQLCELAKNITRHDIHVRHPRDTDAGDQFDQLSRLECLQDGAKHNDPFL